MNNQTKILSGLLCVLIGFIISILAIDLLSKPDNVAISFNPVESLRTYFFSFVFVLGNLGWLTGGLLLISYLLAFYFLGIVLFKLLTKK